jgi:shikimate kinase
MNIVLIGYRGSGKSTIARLLSSNLGMPRICLDDEVVKKAGKSIPEIVRTHGWGYFRHLETEVVTECSRRDGHVLDAGGGVVLRQRNVALLRQRGFLIWLKAPPSVLAERIKDDSQRPALSQAKTMLEEVEEILHQREPLYRSAAHLELDTAGFSPAEVSHRIEEALARLNPEESPPNRKVKTGR